MAVWLRPFRVAFRNSSWHFFQIPPPPEGIIKPTDNERTKDDRCEECEKTAKSNSEVSLFTGGLTETHTLVPYSSLGVTRGVSLHYDSLRADPRPIIHGGLTDAAANSEVVTRISVQQGNFTYQVPGFQGLTSANGLVQFPDLRGGEHFFRTPDVRGGADYGLQLDLRALPTGQYDYTVTTGLIQRWTQTVCLGQSFLQADGTILCAGDAGSVDRVSYTTRSDTDELLIVNSIGSPFGDGWGLAGLQQVVETADGSLLLIDGDGSELIFEPPVTSGESYQNPPGDFSTLVKLSDGTFRRTLKDQTAYSFNARNQLATVVDRNGNETEYQYNAAGDLTAIVDPVGLQTTFTYIGNRITAITDPANRVTRLEYDAQGNLIRITDPDESQRTWGYDNFHHMTSEIDQLGHQEHTFYDSFGRVTRSILKDGSVLNVSPIETQGLFNNFQSNDPATPREPPTWARRRRFTRMETGMLSAAGWIVLVKKPLRLMRLAICPTSCATEATWSPARSTLVETQLCSVTMRLAI